MNAGQSINKIEYLVSEMKNIVYITDEIEKYFSRNRISWDQFYKSEQAIISPLMLGPHQSTLDIGCGCGGLGLAIKDRFGVTSYVGVEINQKAVQTAQILNPLAEIFKGDFLNISKRELLHRTFDVVFSLSCFDWNVQFSEMLNAAWQHVVPGGHLVATFRIVTEDGCDDLSSSFQYINYEGIKKGERAAYVVLNASQLFQQLCTLDPSKISGFGYYGAPSATAVTPFNEICFCAVSIKKRHTTDMLETEFDVDLPKNLLDTLHLMPNAQ